MLYVRVAIFSDHRNLANIFSPEVLVAELSKNATQWLLHWRTHSGQLCDDIMHIKGKESCWGDLLSRLRQISAEADGERKGSLSVCALAVCARADADFSLPSNTAIKPSQLQMAPEDKKMIQKKK